MLAVFGIGTIELIVVGALSLGCLGILGTIIVVAAIASQSGRKGD